MLIKVYHAAADTNQGTDSMVGPTERECEDWILSLVCATRAEYEKAGGDEYEGEDSDYEGGFWAFVADQKNDMDTFNIDYAVIETDDCEPA